MPRCRGGVWIIREIPDHWPEFALCGAAEGGLALAGRGRLGSIGSGAGDGIEVGFGNVRSLLDGLLHRLASVVGSGHGALHHSDGSFRAGGGVLCSAVH